MTIEELVDFVRDAAVERIRPTLEPDEDWAPVAFFWNGQLTPVGFEVESPGDKDFIYGVMLPQMASRLGAWMIATVNTAWALRGEAAQDSLARDVTPSEHEAREEVLVITGHDWTGKTLCWFGDVIRNPSEPPQIGESHFVEGGESLAGRIPDSLRAALVASAPERN